MAPRLGDLVRTTEALNGSPEFQEIVSVTSTTGRQATAFVGGQVLMLANDGTAKVYFKPGSSTVTVTSTTGVPLSADEKIYLILKSTETHIAFITASGTASVYVFKMS